MIAIACPSCQQELTAPESLAGQTFRCPKCQSKSVVPSPAPRLKRKTTTLPRFDLPASNCSVSPFDDHLVINKKGFAGTKATNVNYSDLTSLELSKSYLTLVTNESSEQIQFRSGDLPKWRDFYLHLCAERPEIRTLEAVIHFSRQSADALTAKAALANDIQQMQHIVAELRLLRRETAVLGHQQVRHRVAAGKSGDAMRTFLYTSASAAIGADSDDMARTSTLLQDKKNTSLKSRLTGPLLDLLDYIDLCAIKIERQILANRKSVQ